MNKLEISSIVDEIVSSFSKIHGTVMIAKNDEVIWHQGFSYLEAPLKTDKNSQYLVASITKQFTAAAILRALYDRLALDALHNPIAHWLKPTHHIWNDAMPDWANQVTLHHLLTHTSGIKNLYEPLEFQPSERYAYCNIGYTLLGAVIEEITSEPLGYCFERALFLPANMNDTGLPLCGTPYELKNNPKFQNLALGFERIASNNIVEYSDQSEKLVFDKPSTAGGIISTVYDLAKWNHALYQGKIIPMFLVEYMTKKYIQKDTYPYYDGFDKLWYGYGLDIFEENNKKIYQHCGGLAGYQSKISYNPYTNVTIVNLSNVVEEKPAIFAFANRLRGLL